MKKMENKKRIVIGRLLMLISMVLVVVMGIMFANSVEFHQIPLFFGIIVFAYLFICYFIIIVLTFKEVMG